MRCRNPLRRAGIEREKAEIYPNLDLETYSARGVATTAEGSHVDGVTIPEKDDEPFTVSYYRVSCIVLACPFAQRVHFADDRASHFMLYTTQYQ